MGNSTALVPILSLISLQKKKFVINLLVCKRINNCGVDRRGVCVQDGEGGHGAC